MATGQIEVVNRVEDCERSSVRGDTLIVHYEGKLADGTQFDSSWERGDPLRFTLGYQMVIPGWERGLQSMCKGEVRTITVPPSLGYGEKGRPPVIPGGSTLVFKIELLGFADEEDEAPQQGAAENQAAKEDL